MDQGLNYDKKIRNNSNDQNLLVELRKNLLRA